ncbi:NAD-dependent succinate-semialdehyde dehydrogenase [Rhodococcus zopfii]
MTHALPVGVPTGMWLGGKQIEPEDRARFPVLDPATGEILAEVVDAEAADGLQALDLAVAAQDDWAATAPRVRSEILRTAFDLVVERAETFARVISMEMGKPLPEARGEVSYGAEFLRWFAEEAVRIGGRTTSSPSGSGRILVTKEPVGPVLAITPWNFPLAMATRKIGPALAAGCPIIVKPAAETPLTMLLLGRVFADNLQRTSMELGGNAPFLVFADADLDAAVDGAMAAKMRNGGEACTAANRFLVAREIADEFTDRLTTRMSALRCGHGLDAGTDVGPLITDRQRASVDRLVTDAVGRGARLRTGGKIPDGPGSFYPPTVLDRVPADAPILREEIFGPEATVTTFDDEDEAITSANATESGLAAYLFTRDLDRAIRVSSALNAGMVGVNRGVVSDVAAPFGGVKSSGLGREGAVEGIEEYLDVKYIAL